MRIRKRDGKIVKFREEKIARRLLLPERISKAHKELVEIQGNSNQLSGL